MTNFWANDNLGLCKLEGKWEGPIQSAGGEPSEAQPPDFNRLKCKPVSSAVRKQIENFVSLVPYRARRFSWTRF